MIKEKEGVNMSMEKLQEAAKRFLQKSSGNFIDEVVQQHMGERIEFYESALMHKTKIGIVFNRLKVDGTLVCVCDGLDIIMPAEVARGNVQFAGRLNHPFNVQVTEVDAKNKVVYVRPASEYSVKEQEELRQELNRLIQLATGYVKEHYEDEINAAKEADFKRYCAGLDMVKDADEIDRQMESSEDVAIGNILERLIGDAYFKKEKQETLTEEEKLFNRLILPARIFAARNSGTNNTRAMVDILGMHIRGIILPKHWLDRYTDKELYERELNAILGQAVTVAVLGINRNNEYICSRRVLETSIWSEIDRYFSVGEIIQVCCVKRTDRRYIGRVVGSEDGTNASEFQRIQIMCDMPESLKAESYNVSVTEGGVYLCKIRRIDAKNKFILAKTIRTGGRWIQNQAKSS